MILRGPPIEDRQVPLYLLPRESPAPVAFSRSVYCHISDFIHMLSSACGSARPSLGEVEHTRSRQRSQQLDAFKRTFQSHEANGIFIPHIAWFDYFHLLELELKKASVHDSVDPYCQ